MQMCLFQSLPSQCNVWSNMEQLLSREVESHEQAVSKTMLWAYPFCPLRCWRPGWPPVCMCILYPSASQPSLRFSIFPLVLSVQAFPGVSSGMPVLPWPLLLCSTSSPWLGGLAARWGQPAHLRGSWHAWWPHSSDLRARSGAPAYKRGGAGCWLYWDSY